VAELRFDGRVAIVTGAGGNPGLGRSYALFLASRGARVVVNDLGTGPDGRGIVRTSAAAVVDEIRAAGGEAVADLHSVAGVDGAGAIVQTALDTWGRVDILVNNAGVSFLARFDEIAPQDVERVVAVHLLGTIWMCRAVWPHMQQAGYGRIVNITSGSMLGNKLASVYGAAKGGIFSLTRSLAMEGEEHGIVVNSLMPAAFTVAMAHFLEDSDWKERAAVEQSPDRMAPLAGYLAHEGCTLAGACLAAREGRVYEALIAETAGWRADEPTLEEVATALDEIRDRAAMIENTSSLNAARRAYVVKPYRAPA
jgi:NAD(P)-dependent dehydrogenase (short-subunit alcohol dehydrogenase family)